MDPVSHWTAAAVWIAGDPTVSWWLKKAVMDLLHRDALDAARDAGALRYLMDARVDEALGRGNGRVLMDRIGGGA